MTTLAEGDQRNCRPYKFGCRQLHDNPKKGVREHAAKASYQAVVLVTSDQIVGGGLASVPPEVGTNPIAG